MRTTVRGTAATDVSARSSRTRESGPTRPARQRCRSSAAVTPRRRRALWLNVFLVLLVAILVDQAATGDPAAAVELVLLILWLGWRLLWQWAFARVTGHRYGERG